MDTVLGEEIPETSSELIVPDDFTAMAVEDAFYSVKPFSRTQPWTVAHCVGGKFWLCGNPVGLERVAELGKRLIPGPENDSGIADPESDETPPKSGNFRN